MLPESSHFLVKHRQSESAMKNLDQCITKKKSWDNCVAKNSGSGSTGQTINQKDVAGCSAQLSIVVLLNIQ